MSMPEASLEADLQRLTAENGHLRRALEYGNDAYVLAMAADRDRWRGRAERWKEAARAYRATARENARLLQGALDDLWAVESQ